MKVLLASSEVHPFSKTGGLADMVGALGKALAAAGHDVTIVTPLYRGIRERFTELRATDWHIDVPLGPTRVQAGIAELRLNERLKVCFVDQRDYFHRLALYGESNTDYPDNPQRFIFFAKAVVQFAHLQPNGPFDIVHVHDWQAGLVPALLRHEAHRTGWRAPRTVLTIHNLAYQGRFPASAFALTNLPLDYFTPAGVEFYGGAVGVGINQQHPLTSSRPPSGKVGGGAGLGGAALESGDCENAVRHELQLSS